MKIRTTLCYINNGEGYLMLHRVKKENDVNRDKWIGIGGKIEPRETPEECVRREVLEETGLTLGAVEYRGVIGFSSDKYPSEEMHLFTSDDYSGELAECDEGVLEWVKFDAIPSLPLWEGDHIFLRLIREGAPFFELDLDYTGDRLASAFLDGEELNIGK